MTVTDASVSGSTSSSGRYLGNRLSLSLSKMVGALLVLTSLSLSVDNSGEHEGDDFAGRRTHRRTGGTPGDGGHFGGGTSKKFLRRGAFLRGDRARAARCGIRAELHWNSHHRRGTGRGADQRGHCPILDFTNAGDR